MTEQEIAATLARARSAAESWRQTTLRRRLGMIRATRLGLVRAMPRLLDGFDWGRPPAETLAAEILPLTEAARFLEREATRILASRRPPGRRPLWLAGVRAEIRREPCGVVLILAPGNYPLLLPGVQILQALAAGNAVCVKPAKGRAAPMRLFAELLREAGLPEHVLQVLDEAPSAGEAAVRVGFDKIVLTGSATTGARVLAAAAPNLTPCVMELSGNDPLFVLPGADLDLVANCVAYGLRLNDGATCIAPRRVLVRHADADALEQRLQARLSGPPVVRSVAELRQRAEAAGARALTSDGPLVLAGTTAAVRRDAAALFASVTCLVRVADEDEALAVAAETGYALGATVFGPEDAALRFAARLDAGSVVINDLIVPTADPRLPFGGRRRSGFGVTRGAEGLLEMTVVKTVSIRRGRFRPHLHDSAAGDPVALSALIALSHGPGAARPRALVSLLRASLAGRTPAVRAKTGPASMRLAASNPPSTGKVTPET